jgi:hypothetical protein
VGFAGAPTIIAPEGEVRMRTIAARLAPAIVSALLMTSSSSFASQWRTFCGTVPFHTCEKVDLGSLHQVMPTVYAISVVSELGRYTLQISCPTNRTDIFGIYVGVSRMPDTRPLPGTTGEAIGKTVCNELVGTTHSHVAKVPSPPSTSENQIDQTFMGTPIHPIHYRQNEMHQTVELAGLDSDKSCGPSKSLNGKIVKRDFAADELTVTGFVIESSDGTRDEISVLVPENLAHFPDEVIQDGLQRLLKVGRIVRGRALICGNGGNLVLDQIQ